MNYSYPTKGTSPYTINGINFDDGTPNSHAHRLSWPLNRLAPVLLLFVAMAFSISPCLAQGNDESLFSS